MRRIQLDQVLKSYRSHRSPLAKLREIFLGRLDHRETVVLEPLSLQIDTGEVVGLIGINGAGKSTLLKIIAKTLEPTRGRVGIDGRVCALLELGAGFHPEMTGRENVYLVAAIQGRTRQETDALYDDIVAFSGLSKAMDQPVKTYSSGMLIRLAFSVATSVDPDILILDEALSVGDGAFARRSFERIMRFKDAGKTILFCSHSMYQVEAICTRVLWIDQGRVILDGPPHEVVVAYNAFLDQQETPEEPQEPSLGSQGDEVSREKLADIIRFERICLLGALPEEKVLVLESKVSDLVLTATFKVNPGAMKPVVAVTIVGAGGRPIASASTLNDGFEVDVDGSGQGEVRLVFPKIALLKGRYWLNLFLLCDQGLHVFDRAEYAYELIVRQQSSEIGLVCLTHQWDSPLKNPETDPDLLASL